MELIMASPRLTPIAQRALNAERRLEEVKTERDILRNFIKDLAEHGTRFDLNPTVCAGEDGSTDFSYLKYIGRMDASVRDGAKAVLRRAFNS